MLNVNNLELLIKNFPNILKKKNRKKYNEIYFEYKISKKVEFCPFFILKEVEILFLKILFLFTLNNISFNN